MAVIVQAEDKCTIVTQKDIFRLSAVLYAESNDSISTANIQADIIRCILCENENDAMTDDEIIAAIASSYKYHLSKEEFTRAIQAYKKTFESLAIDGQKKYRLTNRAFTQTALSMEKNIDSFIDRFLSSRPDENAEQGKDAIHKYLYELTTSNINSYRVLLGEIKGNSFSESELSVDVKDLTDHERLLVHDFIAWDDAEKNSVLTNLVFCCLEYCLLVNGDDVNPLVKNAIRKRTIYLDTNILFRALGINGPSREKVMLAFLKKCKQAGLTLVVLHETQREFEDTVAHYISQIREFPRGSLYSGAFEQLSDYNMFSFFDAWRAKHESLSLDYFSRYIKALYLGLCKEYKIIRNYRIPNEVFNSDQFRQVCDQYAHSIQARKQQIKDYYVPDDMYYSARDRHDARVVSYIEHSRHSASETDDIFMASSDKALRYWDMNRDHDDYPVVVYPSQLFLILIKMCGRSDNDFESFVSFINIRPRSKQITAEKANVILSGISSITEDLQAQKTLVDSVFDEDFQNIIQQSSTDQELYQKVQLYSQNYLDDQLKEKEKKLHEAAALVTQKSDENADLVKTVAERDSELKQQEEELKKRTAEIKRKEAENEDKRKRICQFAERKTRFPFVMKWYVFPAVAALIVIAFGVFVLLQFAFCDKSWNVANIVFDYVAKTTFGKNVDSYIAVIDSAAFAILGVAVFPQFKIRPWDKEKREEDKQKRIEQYIKRYNLQ